MADIGAKYIKFSPIKEQPEGKFPVYRDEGPVELGNLVGTETAPHMAEGSLYAGNELAENLSMFAYADLDLETDDMLDEIASTIYGCEVVDGLVHYKSGDVPPEGGLAYYKNKIRRGVPYFQGIFHPRAKATLGSDSAKTRTDTITFSTTKTKFKLLACNAGEWKITGTFATEAEAVAWVDKMLAGAKSDSGEESGDNPDVEAAG
ncbi:MAG: hypothetical protein HDT35_01860 [Clostridiales bacterium]|nr:hypothetical protein [Clostridiales bacterium]